MKIVSFFSGAGGMDLGFMKAGFELLWANEYDKTIWATHEKNFPFAHLCKKSIIDIKNHEVPHCDGIIGGPPCQSFSQAGAKRGIQDPRGQLFWQYIRLLEAKKPKFFVAENVSGLLAPRHKESLDKILQSFSDAGYDVVSHLYKASDYDVPQDRLRFIMVGYRKDLKSLFSIPNPIESDVSLKTAIGDLPESVACAYGKSNCNLLISNHEHMLGGWSSMFMSRNRVRAWTEPSFTILASARQIPLHPSAPAMIKIKKDSFIFAPDADYRRLSVRECARIQTFPDNFKFIYDRIEHGYKMVGNAVPVNLAFFIARKIKQDLF